MEIYIHIPEKKPGKDDRVYDRIQCLEQYIRTREEILESKQYQRLKRRQQKVI